MLRRMLGLIASFVAATVLVALAVANRHSVPLVLDPFRPETPAVQVVLPFYAHIIGTLIVGVLLGGFATWFSQRHWRHSSRKGMDDAKRWRTEAERLTRERDANILSASAQPNGSKGTALTTGSRRTAA